MKPKFLLVLIFSCLSTAVFSQTNTASSSRKLFFEKVYLHLDREFFSSGDDIWFKAYLLNAQADQLLNTSNNLYVELISPETKIIDRKVIRLEEGLGAGDFKLGDSIPGGKYKLRAYTNWMRNFGDNFFFEKQLTINGLEGNTSGVSSVNSNPSGSNVNSASESKNILRFFPEGGSMINTVSGIVAFKAESMAGKGVKVKAAVISSAGDTVTTFESKESGIGSFAFLPMEGLKYQVKGYFDDKTPFTSTLPEALPNGFSIHAINTDSTKLRIVISTNEATLAEYKGREFDIKGRHTGIPYFSAKFNLAHRQTVVDVLKSDFPGGIAAFTLSDDKGRPHCERLVYFEPKHKVKLNLITSKPFYKSKERVTINVKAVNELNQPVKADLSVAAVDAGLVPEKEGNIVSYMLLESEVRGKVEKPEQYFDRKNPNRLKQLDLLLMTQGWRDFVWRRLKDTTLKISFLNETGFTISGKVTEKNSEKPLAGANVTLFANGAKGTKLLAATTDAAGKYYFDQMNLAGSQSIKLNSTKLGKKIGNISVDSLYPHVALIRPFQGKFDDFSLYTLFKKETDRRKNELKKFSLSDTLQLKEVQVKSSKHVTVFGDVLTSFGYPDQNFIITPKDHDYRSLSHFLLHRVKGAMPANAGSSNAVEFISDGKRVSPRFFVDRRENVFFDDHIVYYELPMDQIEKVVVRHMIGSNQLGLDSATSMSTVTPGGHVYLIYLTLKPTAFARQEPSILNTNVTGYYQQRLFYSPTYLVNSGKTDLRTTVYWQPNVKTNENGEATVTFYNADPKSKIRVIAEGVSENGIPAAGLVEYEVK